MRLSAGTTQIIRDQAGNLSYQLATTQTTGTLLINAANDAVTRRSYDPYGNPRGTTPTNWISPTDTRGFLNQPADTTSGLDLLGARQYNPTQGRFLSPDPIFEAGDPNQMGGYTYAADNPHPRRPQRSAGRRMRHRRSRQLQRRESHPDSTYHANLDRNGGAAPSANGGDGKGNGKCNDGKTCWSPTVQPIGEAWSPRQVARDPERPVSCTVLSPEAGEDFWVICSTAAPSVIQDILAKIQIIFLTLR